MRFFATPTCEDLPVTNSDVQNQLTLVNSLILDSGALQGRAEEVLGVLGAMDDHDSKMRVKAVQQFIETLNSAASRLRQEGLHPGAQGALW